PPLNTTPSASSFFRWRAYAALPSGKEIRPEALMTRNHGTPRELGVWRSTVPTKRARRGKPATSAIAPYVLTRPLGIRFTAARMRSALDASAALASAIRGLRCFARAIARLRMAASDRHAIVDRLFRAVGAIGITTTLAAAQRDAERGHERQHALKEIAGRVGQRMEQQRENRAGPHRTEQRTGTNTLAAQAHEHQRPECGAQYAEGE